MSTQRLFIAVDLEESLKQAMDSFMEPLRKAGADVKWVQPGNLHITLKFLGEVAEEKTALIVETARRALKGYRQFEITLSRLGTFPPAGKPRVIWIGIEDAGGQLVAMGRSLEEAFAQIGFPAEPRPFKPHLTLGRVRSPRGVERLQTVLAKSAMPATKSMNVEKVLLFRSVLTSAGPIYTVLEKIDLGSP